MSNIEDHCITILHLRQVASTLSITQSILHYGFASDKLVRTVMLAVKSGCWHLLPAAVACTALATAQVQQLAAPDVRCSKLAGLDLPNTEITGATAIPAAPANPDHPTLQVPPIPAHCRVALTLRPTSDSAIRVEVWLPEANWNGRLLGVGVGGFAGVINRGELATAIQRGYAAAATDTGHQQVGTELWARGHPERVIDYGYRAIHLMTLAAKDAVSHYYGMPAHHAYFSGCSNGGREGLMEAARFPADYDGILAGAPAADFIGLVVAGFGANAAALRQHPFPVTKLRFLREATLAACDNLDGAKDGLIGAPEQCQFKPAAWRCPEDRDHPNCFTANEVAALDAIYRGASTPAGKILYPGYSPGGEEPQPPSPGWAGWLIPKPGEPSEPLQMHTSFMRDFLRGGAAWTPASFDLEHDYARAKAELGPVLDADQPDLSAFAARGGKLILFHGWADQAIPPRATLKYYTALTDAMGTARTGQFVRLYMAPGMQHCWLGPGPWSFNWSAARPGADPKSDISASLEAWVEKQRAPGPITAVRPRNPYSILAGYPPLEVERSGLLCPYPQVARLAGGSPKNARNYACVSRLSD